MNFDVCVRVKTEKQYNKLITYLYGVGCFWSSGEDMFIKNRWNTYKSETCLSIESGFKRLKYSPYRYYKNKCYNIVEFGDISKNGKIDEDKLNRLAILYKLEIGK